jgi:uncharacterized protein (DUF433 family)
MMTDEDELIARYVELNPYHPGADDAWIVGYGVPVWAIIGAIHAAETAEAIVEQTAEEYQLPVSAVRAALVYYQRHVDVINARIVANVAV